MLNNPFSPWPRYSQEEISAVSEVLASNKVNYWTGTVCQDFEKAFAQYTGACYSVALANGTLALDLALKVLGIGPGDEVVVTPRTFMASASTVVTAGAVPVFADVDPDTQNITAETISSVLTPRTKAIIPVHLGGMPCDMDPIMGLAGAKGLFVIEDCAQAHGATYKGRSVGTIGHVGAWSFCQDKIMTTGGEGGMVTTNDEKLWSAMWSYKDHGKSWDAVYNRQHNPGPRLVHDTFGTNWRMLEMQGAIGLIQTRLMPQWSQRRSEIANTIANALRRSPAVRVPELPNYANHAYYRLYAFVRPQALLPGWTRDRIVEEIEARGVPCLHGTQSEVYLERAFADAGLQPKERLPVARELGETSIAFLVHPTLEDSEVAKTCSVAAEVLAMATA